jgi:predicted GTPase
MIWTILRTIKEKVVEKPIPIVIPVNKEDLVIKDDVQWQLIELGEFFSSTNTSDKDILENSSIITTSARTGHNLNNLFHLALAKSLLFHYQR